jgi:carboxypeptidase Q
MRKSMFFLPLLISCQFAMAQNESPDHSLMARIREEGINHSSVMDIAYHLTDGSGPRLTGSPGWKRAAEWARATLQQWGLVNTGLEPWGIFGKGWELQKSYVAMKAPYYKPLMAFPKTWTGSTQGLQEAEILLVQAKDSIELQAYAGKMKGKFILLPRTDTLKPSFNPDARRLTEEDLAKLASYDPKVRDTSNRFRNAGRPGNNMQMINKIKEMARQEGAIAIFSANPRGKDGTLFVQGGGPYSLTSAENFLDVVLAFEDYMTLYRLVLAGASPRLEMDIRSRFLTDDPKGYNVIGEIRGSDPKLKEELVMAGGHLDSWQGATGATDNAAGCAVVMEAIRILKALGIQPRRTIRVALWSGEEQGLLGSRNYVRNHFTDTLTKRYNSEGDKVAAYFNLDNGSGKIRGIYTQGNEAVREIFSQWLEPFHDLGAGTITLQNTGGTDHLSFDAIGLAGFQFIQDPIEYDTRTHHTTMDSYDHLLPDDLKQAATVMAAFIYQASIREGKLPRKPIPATGTNRP